MNEAWVTLGARALASRSVSIRDLCLPKKLSQVVGVVVMALKTVVEVVG